MAQSQEDKLKEYMGILTAQGMTAEAAAAMLGNAMQESGENLNVAAHNNISGGHDGLFQWDKNRWAAFKKWISPLGLSVGNAAAQLEFAVKELKDRGQFNTMNNFKNPRDAAAYFNEKFEVSGADNKPRQDYAQYVYDGYKSGKFKPLASKAADAVPDAASAAAKAAADAALSALTGATSGAWNTAAPVLIKGVFVVGGLFLVGAGVTSVKGS
jgi:hypothetical protein